jgi:hypothetical protein
LAIPLSSAISPFLMQLTASSAALSAGIASASSFSQSVLIALASFAIKIDLIYRSHEPLYLLYLPYQELPFLQLLKSSKFQFGFNLKIICSLVF